jgi:hypothetical protein
MRFRYALYAAVLFITAIAFGQEAVLRLTPYTVSSKYLNQQIADDTTANGFVAGRVYELQRGGLYLVNRTFRNAGWTLRLRANDSATTRRPVVMMYPTGTGTNPQNPPGNFIDVQGSIELRNLIISGYYEPLDTNIRNLQGALFTMPSTASGNSIYVDSCIITNTNGNHIRTDGAPKVVKVTNSIFANMGYLGRSNLGAGKGIDLRDVSVDTVIFSNNTFLNWQDRIIRHYSLTATPTGPIRYLKFDHNTLINGMSYHGVLSLGSMGGKAMITNNLFIDPFSLGNDSDYTRQLEFASSGEKDQFGANRMTWILSTPNDSTKWTIANNYYSISDSGQAFYALFASAGVTGEGSPLTWHINSKLGADSVNAFKKISLGVTKAPPVMVNLNRWYRSATGGKKSKNTPGAWVYGPTNVSPYVDPFDYGRKNYIYLRDSLNGSYSTLSMAYTADRGKYPAGDLNWFPAKYAEWRSDPTTSVRPNSAAPAAYSLEQNYPNPFNPSTTIKYQVPVSGLVSLKVYNLIGQEVATLVNEFQSASGYETSFDASKLSSGIYFYTLRAGSFVETKKMLLVK